MNQEELLNKLEAAGCDVEGTIKRLADDRDFYIHLLETFFQERSWESLTDSMEIRDYRKAFEQAHLLKGTILTLGLMPLLGTVAPLLEKLRKISAGQAPLKEPDFTENDLWEDYRKFLEEIRSMPFSSFFST